MELLGQVGDRAIFYLNVRSDFDWKKQLQPKTWVAFTIANKEDRKLVSQVIPFCLDQGVAYTCSAGEIAYLTEQLFDEEIVERGIKYEDENVKPFDYNYSPMTTAHSNFSEGFWFAATLAYDDYVDIGKVICLDFTHRKVKKQLLKLISRINDRWLPSDEEIELPIYDD